MDQVMMDQTLALEELNRKVDTLTTQVAFLAEEARVEQRRRQEWDELKSDLTPVASEVYQLSVRQLDEIENYVQLEDIIRVSKRLMRNTRNIEQMLDQLESLADLTREFGPISDGVFLSVMTRLDEMERKGYFAFLQGGMEIMDQIITNFSEEDVRQLGENIVLILETVKEMTQPEIMTLLSSSAHVIREDDVPEDVSMFAILRQLNDPAVRRGLAKTLNVLKTVSESQVSKN
ncbi:MAG: hypothetical protein AMJ56_05400 [Anaerolineae bacterium SG8_19]|jgi:uncharacterized protein YjgD (DUF1641 family)|nr:MAG: hypothetical protein AMJ56_05400 [Anaerolineae bacterium SG8_19]